MNDGIRSTVKEKYGKAYGVDMTEEMLALARRNAAEAGIENVEFLKGDIEDLPLPDKSVDGKLMAAFVRARKPQG